MHLNPSECPPLLHRGEHHDGCDADGQQGLGRAAWGVGAVHRGVSLPARHVHGAPPGALSPHSTPSLSRPTQGWTRLARLGLELALLARIVCVGMCVCVCECVYVCVYVFWLGVWLASVAPGVHVVTRMLASRRLPSATHRLALRSGAEATSTARHTQQPRDLGFQRKDADRVLRKY